MGICVYGSLRLRIIQNLCLCCVYLVYTVFMRCLWNTINCVYAAFIIFTLCLRDVYCFTHFFGETNSDCVWQYLLVYHYKNCSNNISMCLYVCVYICIYIYMCVYVFCLCSCYINTVFTCSCATKVCKSFCMAIRCSARLRTKRRSGMPVEEQAQVPSREVT